MEEYYYAALNRIEQEYYRRLVSELERETALVKVPAGMSMESARKVSIAVNYDHPEFFYVDFKYLQYHTGLTGLTYQVGYIGNAGQRARRKAQLAQSVAFVAAQAGRAGLKNDWEKCQWIHDYLIDHVTYDHAALKDPDGHPDAFGVSGVFLDQVAVCEGISKAFLLLCERLSVRAIIANGKASCGVFQKNASHAWNMVWLGNACCHVDVTWDLNYSEASKVLRYDYFCLSDDWMKKDHFYRGFPVCNTDDFHCLKRQGLWFTDGEQLRGYLAAELGKQTPMLYFKVDSAKAKGKKFARELEEKVQEAASLYCTGRFLTEYATNEDQMCFLFRITKNYENGG